jgi:hypothetical protein
MNSCSRPARGLCDNTPPQKISSSRNIQKGLGLWWILSINDLSKAHDSWGSSNKISLRFWKCTRDQTAQRWHHTTMRIHTFQWIENENHTLGAGVLCIRESYQQLKRDDILSDRMAYVTLGGRWCDTVMNDHTPSDYKTDDLKDSFCEEFNIIFSNFLNCHTQILLASFSARTR